MKSARRRARALALQALYAWQMSGESATGLQSQAEQRAAPKGRDCADVAVEMARLVRAIDKHHR